MMMIISDREMREVGKEGRDWKLGSDDEECRVAEDSEVVPAVEMHQ